MLLESKENATKCINENIREQINGKSLMAQLSAFDLVSHDSLEDRLEKVRNLFNAFGTNFEHILQESWNGFQISLKYRRKLICDEVVLISQFKDFLS